MKKYKQYIQPALFILCGIVILALFFIYLGIIPLNGLNPWSPDKISKQAEIYSVSGGNVDPVFMGQLIIDPAEPKIGERQNFSIWAKDSIAIKTVTLLIQDKTGANKEIELKLKEGSKKEGRWEGNWKVERLSSETQYTASFKAINQDGKTTELTTFFNISGDSIQGLFRIKRAYAYDACTFSDMGSTNISSSCIIPSGSTMGTNEGDLTISSPIEMQSNSILGAEGGDINVGSTVTMRQNATLIFNQGQSINFTNSSAYIIKQETTTVIRKDHLAFYQLTVSKSGSGTVTSNPTGIDCGATCSKYYIAGTSVTLTASASTGYTFTGWSGACSGTGTCTVSMTAARSVTANFTENCDCTSGDCCSDGCHYDTTSHACSTWTETDYSCPWGTSCGADVGRRTRTDTKYCSGSNASCTGSTSYGSWSSYSVFDNCASTETCADNDSSCNYTASCDCECSSGACCSDGCHYDTTSHACSTWTETDYSCPWGTSCGADVGRRTRTDTKYCSGSNASCTGSTSYGSWSSYSVFDNCASTETCADNDSSCNNNICGCVNYCGDGNCRCGETSSSCSADCGSPVIHYRNDCEGTCNSVCAGYGKSCVGIRSYFGWDGYYWSIGCSSIFVSSNTSTQCAKNMICRSPFTCCPASGTCGQADTTFCKCQ